MHEENYLKEESTWRDHRQDESSKMGLQ